MRKLAIIAGVVLALGACKKDKWEQAVSDEKGFRDKMCACKDKACTEDVHKQYKEWEKGMEDKIGKDDKPPEKVMEEADKVEREMKDCRKKYRDEAAAPGTPGTADQPPSAAAPAAPAAPAPAPANP